MADAPKPAAPAPATAPPAPTTPTNPKPAAPPPAPLAPAPPPPAAPQPAPVVTNPPPVTRPQQPAPAGPPAAQPAPAAPQPAPANPPVPAGYRPPVAAQGAGLDVLAAAPDEPRPGHGHPATAVAPANLPAFVTDKPSDANPKPRQVDTGARPGIELPPPPLSEMAPTAINAPPSLLGGRPRVPAPPPITPGPGDAGYDRHLARVARQHAARYEDEHGGGDPGTTDGHKAARASADFDRKAASKLYGVTPGPLHTGDAKFGRSDATGSPEPDEIDHEAAPPHTAVNDDPNVAHVTCSRILGMTPQAAAAACHERFLTYREAPPGEPVVTGPGEDRPATQEESKAGAAHPHDKASVMATRQPEYRADRVSVTIGHDGLVSLAWVG